jgi:heptosyltransferase III
MRRLVIRPGGIGDVIVSLPALELLTGPSDQIWVPGRMTSLIRFGPRARSIATTGLDLLAITDPSPQLLTELRAFDSIVSWYGANRPDFRDAVAALDLPFTFLPALPTEGSAPHAADFYLDQVRPLATGNSDGIPRIPTPAADRENFAVIHPFSGSPRKNWPLENFQALAAKLEPDLPVRWCAGNDDPPLPDAVRFPDLYDLACWLAKASLYVGNDSGITHLAAAVGTPVLAFFGPTDPAVWAPRGPNVRIGRWQER